MLEVGTRVMAKIDYIGPDEAASFDWGWFPICGDEGVIVNSFKMETGEIAHDIQFDEDDLPSESWPYLASEIEEVAA